MKLFSKISIYMKRAVFLFASASVIVSCNKFMDINDTPNNPLEVPASTLLPTGLSAAAFANSNDLNRFGSTIMSVTAGALGSPASFDIYVNQSSDFGNQWRFEIYGGALINLQKMIEQTEEASPHYAGIGKILQAYVFALTTDTWGDIPYSEALLGDGEQEIVNPRLDSQRDIYLGNESLGIKSLFDLVREGIADLNRESVLSPGNDDIAYGGDVANWKRAGYTLMLKMAMQISSVEPDFSRNVINEVIAADDLIESNDQNLNVNFGGQVGSQSPIHTYTNVSSFRSDMLISSRFVSRLQQLNDPRLPIFVTQPTGSYVTIDNGFRGTVPPLAQRSMFSSYVTGANGEGPVRLITNWQRAFLLAEASIRLGTAGDAQSLYSEGVRASMLSAGISDTDIDGYFNAHPEVAVLTGTNEQQIEQIINQKYISLFGNGLEQWNDFRRTGYPVLAEHQNAVGVVETVRPLRAVYIDQELQRNPNFPQGVPPQNNVRVWWDVQ